MYSIGREGEGHRKEYSVYALDNVDNLDDPLKHAISALVRSSNT